MQPIQKELTGVTDTSISPLPSTDTNNELAEIRDLLRHIVDVMKDRDSEACVADEWKALAMVLDRIFFWLTLFTSVIMIPTFLLRTGDTIY